MHRGIAHARTVSASTADIAQHCADHRGKPDEDVSLWYALRGDATCLPDFDLREYRAMRWFRFDEVPIDDTDPNLERFLGKLSRLAIAV